jgi:hypothetical protein
MNSPEEEPLLPPGFSDLEPFVAYWAGDTTASRWRARCSASMDQIRAFYDITILRGEDALAYLETYELDELTPEAARLLCLVLALGQAAMAVEIHNQPRAPGTPWPNSLAIERGVAPYG